jgi:hypothetical protein
VPYWELQRGVRHGRAVGAAQVGIRAGLTEPLGGCCCVFEEGVADGQGRGSSP